MAGTSRGSRQVDRLAPSAMPEDAWRRGICILPATWLAAALCLAAVLCASVPPRRSPHPLRSAFFTGVSRHTAFTATAPGPLLALATALSILPAPTLPAMLPSGSGTVLS